MISMGVTPNYAGVILYGDKKSLKNLYETVVKIANNKTTNSNQADCLSYLFKDIRYAYQGKREIIREEDSEKIYYGVKILFPMLMAEFYILHKFVTNKSANNDGINIDQFEHCIRETLGKIDPNLTDMDIEFIILSSRIPSGLLVPYLNKVSTNYYGLSKEDRQNRYCNILLSLESNSKEYTDFLKEAEKKVKKIKPCQLILKSKNTINFVW